MKELRPHKTVRPSVGHLGAVLSVTFILGPGFVVFASLLARVIDPLAFLIADSWQRAIAVGAGAAVGLAAHLLLPRRLRWWWCIPALPLAGIAYVAVMVADLSMHMRLGTPMADCEVAGMEVDHCEGRDQTFGPFGAFSMRAEGTVHAQVRAALIAEAIPSSQSLRSHDGPACSLEDPGEWTRVECNGDLMPGMTECYWCGWRSASHNYHRYELGFAAVGGGGVLLRRR